MNQLAGPPGLNDSPSRFSAQSKWVCACWYV